MGVLSPISTNLLCFGGGFDECRCVCGVGFVTDVVVVVRGCNGGGC